MIKHIVLLNWKDGVSAEDIEKVTSGFAAIRDGITEIKSYEFGPDAGIYNGNTQYALVAEFENQQDLATYANHPLHLKFLKEIAGPILDSFSSAQFII